MLPRFSGRIVAAALGMLFLLPGAFAKETNWTGIAGSDWFAAANWSAGLPLGGDWAYVDGSATSPPRIDAGSAVAEWLKVGTGVTQLALTGGELATQTLWVDEAYLRQTGGVNTTTTLMLWSLNHCDYTLDGGELRIRPGGRLVMDTWADFHLNGGAVVATSATLVIGQWGGERFHVDAGSVVADRILVSNASSADNGLHLWGGSVRTRVLEVGRRSDPFADWYSDGLTIAGSAALEVSQSLYLGPRASIIAATGCVVSLGSPASTASLVIDRANPNWLGGLAALRLATQGQVTIEAAGADRGATASGFVANFGLGGIDLQGSRLVLADAFDNAPGAAPEALYVDELTIGPGSSIDTGGASLYYRNGGPPKQFFGGDLNLDGGVNIGDLATLAQHWGGRADWSGGDFTGDGLVTIGDLVLLAQNYGRHTEAAAQAVPEVSVVVCLCGGAAVLLGRRRGAGLNVQSFARRGGGRVC